jgi:hypothetical protein
MRKLIIGVVISLGLTALLLNVGPKLGFAVSIQETDHKQWGNLHMIQVDATFDATDATYTDYVLRWPINGKLIYVLTDPGATAPTDNYDITLKNQNTLDVMGGNLANRDTANTEYATPPEAECPVDGHLTLGMSGNTTSSAQVTLKIYYEAP